MLEQIRESDWKVFRDLHEPVLARCCEKILSEVTQIVNDTGKGSHERYGLLYGHIKKCDKEIAELFNDFRRSTALFQLVKMKSRGLLTDEEYARFSEETRTRVNGVCEAFRPRE